MIQALARAVYARKQALVADDVFSGLDMDTRHHVGATYLVQRAFCVGHARL
jgi:ABC-type nitrate/sulfonate/bicarbonate transport system ATPase subunit